MRSHNPDCYTYIEHGSKNRTGELRQLGLENKSVPCPAVPENHPKCLVFPLDEYLRHLPKYAFKKDILYLRPKPKLLADPEEAWYENSPVGRSTLSTMVKRMCMDAGIEHDQKSNHSLRATGATAMFQSNVPETVIQKTTGHQSLQALLTYERTSAAQHQDVSKI